MKEKLAILATLFVMAGCGNVQYEVEKIDNPPFKPNVEFIGFEDLNHPGFKHLIDKYQLDTIFHGETDEFKRILLLRNCLKKSRKKPDSFWRILHYSSTSNEKISKQKN